MSPCGEPGQFAFMAPFAKSGGLSGAAIGGRQAIARRPSDHEPFFSAEMAFKHSFPQRSHTVAHIVADTVGRIDQSLVPVGVEQRRKTMRFVMIDKMQFRVRAEAVLSEKQFAAKQPMRVGNAGSLADRCQIPLKAPAPETIAQRVVDVAHQREAEIVQRKGAANGRDRIHIVARPAGDMQHFVDGEPGDRAAPALFAPQTLFLNRRDQLVVLEGRRGCVMRTGLKRQNSHGQTASAGADTPNPHRCRL